MTDFEKEIIQMYDWLERRAKPKSHLQKNQKAIEISHIKTFVKDFKRTVEKYREGLEGEDKKDTKSN
ncbi:hypothetical protein [Bacillus phage YungSlug]|nr:hypothetical protein [Bacillus phage YungSlug]